MNTSIIIAGDHPLMLRGLKDFLASKGYNIIGSTDDLSISNRTIDKHRSNIVAKLELSNKPTSLSLWANMHKIEL